MNSNSNITMDINVILSSIENAISNYKSKVTTEDTFCRVLQGYTRELLAYILGLDPNDAGLYPTKTNVVHHYEEHEPFFGVRAFPSSSIAVVNYYLNIANRMKNDYQDYNSENERNSAILNLTDNIFRSTIMIELDSMMFDSNIINLNPKEITALIVNAMANTLSTQHCINFIQNVIYRLIILPKDTLKIRVNVSTGALGFLLNIPQYMYFSKISLPIRLLDDTSNKYGFEISEKMNKLNQVDDFISATQKILKVFGSNVFCDQSCIERVNAEITTMVKFMMDFYKRRNQLRDRIALNIRRTSSEYIRDINRAVLENLGVNLHEVYSGVAMESMSTDIIANAKLFPTKYKLEYDDFSGSYMQIVNTLNKADMVMESVYKARKKDKNLLPSDHDIDILYIEYDRMNCQGDRAYVLDLIYEQLNKIGDVMEYHYANDIQKYNQMKPIADGQIKRLNELRQMVLQKRNFDKRYMVFVKSPVGYEG